LRAWPSVLAGPARRAGNLDLAATLASWFGVSAADLPLVVPNIVNWDPAYRNIGFV